MGRDDGIQRDIQRLMDAKNGEYQGIKARDLALGNPSYKGPDGDPYPETSQAGHRVVGYRSGLKRA